MSIMEAASKITSFVDDLNERLDRMEQRIESIYNQTYEMSRTLDNLSTDVDLLEQRLTAIEKSTEGVPDLIEDHRRAERLQMMNDARGRGETRWILQKLP